MASHLKDIQEEVKLDLTPMIDCVFLLIIFFLCIEFKALEAKLPAYLPKDKGSQNDPAQPQEQLSIRIEVDQPGTKIPRKPSAPEIDKKGRKRTFALIDHTVKWDVGPTRFTDIERMRKELERIKSDPSSIVPDASKPGQTKLLPIVIEPQQGATYGDVASTVDVVKAVGFEEINFGGGRGPAPKR